ncbi:hypothetical protein BV20DRAFT_132231 [Pilatotrama ljubarskyi]|nr:hypothetical protein BV20DRAFT_132231 [Pilatotrama ljubarskyi]
MHLRRKASTHLRQDWILTSSFLTLSRSRRARKAKVSAASLQSAKGVRHKLLSLRKARNSYSVRSPVIREISGR